MLKVVKNIDVNDNKKIIKIIRVFELGLVVLDTPT